MPRHISCRNVPDGRPSEMPDEVTRRVLVVAFVVLIYKKTEKESRFVARLGRVCHNAVITGSCRTVAGQR